MVMGRVPLGFYKMVWVLENEELMGRIKEEANEDGKGRKGSKEGEREGGKRGRGRKGRKKGRVDGRKGGRKGSWKEGRKEGRERAWKEGRREAGMLWVWRSHLGLNAGCMNFCNNA